MSQPTARYWRPFLALIPVLGLACGGADVASIQSFTAEPSSVTAGATTKLSWSVSGATRVEVVAEPGGTVVGSSSESSGTLTTEPIVRPTVFVLTAFGEDGDDSAVVTVSVSGQAGAIVINRFEANPSAIPAGDTTSLSWDVTGADSITIRDSEGTEVVTSAEATGSQDVTPTATEAYTLIAVNDAGDAANAVAVVTVNLGGTARIVSFTAAPTAVDFGEASTLSWEVQQAPGGIRVEARGEVVGESTDPSGTMNVYPGGPTEYRLIAINPDGSAIASVQVTTNDSAPAIRDFTAMPNPAGLGGTTTLSWRALGATRVRLERGTQVLLDTNNDPSSAQVFLPAASNVFTLRAFNALGTASSTTAVTTGELPVIVDLSATPASFEGSSTATVTWETTGADDVELLANGVAVASVSGQASGDVQVPVSETTLFELRATNTFGTRSRTIAVTLIQDEGEPNDSTATAIDLGTAAQVRGSAGGGDRDIFSVDVPTGGWVRAQARGPQGGCFPGQLAFVEPDGLTVRPTASPGPCPGLDPAVDPNVRNLPGGRYYIVLDGAATAGYLLDLRTGAPECGNGIPESSEQCDDANQVGGDGCNAGCQIEPLGIVSGLDVEMEFTGSLDAAGEVDFYQVDLQTSGLISAAFYFPTAPDCQPSGSFPPEEETELLLLAEDFSLLGSSNNGGNVPCPAIDPARDAFARVGPGVYYVALRHALPDGLTSSYSLVISTSGEACGNRIREGSEECDDGNLESGDGCDGSCLFEGPTETEPNDQFDDSGVLTLTASVGAFQGAISNAADDDVYAVTVPQGYALTAQLYVDGSNSCTTQGPRIELLDVDGATVRTSAGVGFPSSCPALNINPLTVNLPAGTYYIRVSSSGALPSYFLFVALQAPECGNDFREGTEECDDGDLDSQDGCSDQCTLELAQTFDSNGGVATFSVPTDGFAVVEVVLDQPGQAITATVSSGGGCPPGLDLELRDESFELINVGPVPDSPCVIAFPTSRYATNRPATSHYLVVRNLNPTGATSAQLEVSVIDPGCGNRATETLVGEQCDDGNQAAGDGCSDTCQFETLGTYVAPGAPQTFAGAIDVIGQLDVYQVTVNQEVYLDVETFAPTVAAGCEQSADTELFLLASDATTELGRDDQGGQNNCSRIAPTAPYARLAPGTYFVVVADWQNNSLIPAYEVVFKSVATNVCGNGVREPDNQEVCDDGNMDDGDGCDSSCQLEGSFVPEVEPNDDLGTATDSTLDATGTVTVTGEIGAVGDLDYYSFVVPSGSTLTLVARTYTTPGDPMSTCGSDVDTRIRFYNDSGTELAENDDNPGQGLCSLIDGSSTHPGAGNLGPGTYYIAVQHWNNSGTTGPYLMDISLQ